MSAHKFQELALAVINTEARAVAALADEIREPSFVHACHLMLECK